MKLKTQIDGTAGDYLLVLDGDSDLSGYGQLEHDVAAAHALMQAMEEKASEYSLAALALMIGPIKKRASELMREWGFDSGEQAE